MADVTNNGRQGTAADASPDSGQASVQSAESLRVLKEQVHAAISELRRLRKENAVLTARLTTIQESATLSTSGITLDLKKSPEQVRSTVKGFIRSLDRYLAEVGD